MLLLFVQGRGGKKGILYIAITLQLKYNTYNFNGLHAI